MRYVSTRDAAHTATLSEALARGIAPDGGLYVPEAFPGFALDHFEGATTLADVAARFLAPFFAGDPLAPALGAIVREAFDFPVPLVPLKAAGDLAVLELFHGPTAAFKDFGARFLAACLQTLDPSGIPHRTVLVATSGDTGSASGSSPTSRA